MRGPGFDTPIERLPASLPLFPLTGVLLLPRGRLPLNVFEPRYLNMTDDVLAGDRLIGIIQPAAAESDRTNLNPQLFKTGCVGRVTAFAEEGARYLITLTGICRFDIGDELATTRGYRRVVPDWTPYRNDFKEEGDGIIDRLRLIAGLKAYFKANGLSADWSVIEGASDERLVTSLAMLCPFRPEDKQALLQAASLAERGKLLTGLVEMALYEASPDDAPPLRH
jgi:Lon protease-like protein